MPWFRDPSGVNVAVVLILPIQKYSDAFACTSAVLDATPASLLLLGTYVEPADDLLPPMARTSSCTRRPSLDL